MRDELLASIVEIEKIPNELWINNLEERKLKELEFHNRDRDREFKKQAQAQDTYEKFYGNKKYYSVTARSREYINKWIVENSKDKVFLDYACGEGMNALMAAQAGAELALGLDISDVSIGNCKETANQQGLSENTRFFQADAENTRLPSDSIDTIVCTGMLHHLDLSYALPELRRILKPGGKILAVEALDYNPFIKLYRLLTPDMRTDWEKAHILSLKDLDFARRFFQVENIRYWHVIGYAGALIPFLRVPLDVLDRILERLPLFKLLAWQFTFELVKE